MREPDRPARRHRRLHAAAERARRHRGGPVGAAPRRATASCSSPAPRSARTTARGCEKHAPRDGSVYVNDVTSAYACLCLWGPRARDVLQPLTKTLARLPVHARRASSRVGDVPRHRLARHVRRRARLGALLPRRSTGSRSGTRLHVDGVTPGGYRAIDALRLEKGYRAWASDLTPETTPDEAGLGFAVKRDKGAVHRPGRAAASRRSGSSASCSTIRARSRSAPSPCAPRTATIVGRVTSGGYGYAVGASIALAYVPARAPEPGTRSTVDIFGDWVAAEVRAEPLYDPKGERVRGVTVVVVGGGIAGVSFAYHLAKAGVRDVVLVEKGELTSGSTHHAAGLVTQFNPSPTMMRFRRYSVELYRELGVFEAVGSAADRVEPGELRGAPARRQSRARDRARRRARRPGGGAPPDAGGVAGRRSTAPSGCRATATSTRTSRRTRSRTAARALGADIRTHTRVTGIELGPRREVRAVLTDQGRIETETVVNAAGMWAPQVAAMVGAFVCSIPVDHQHIALHAVAGHELPRDMPCFRDTDNLVYGKAESGGVLFGGYEANPVARWEDGVPWEHGAALLPPDQERFAPLMAGAVAALPVPRRGGRGRARLPSRRDDAGREPAARPAPRSAGLLDGGRAVAERLRRRRRDRQGARRAGHRRRGRGRRPAVPRLALRRPVPRPGVRGGGRARGLPLLLPAPLPARRRRGRAGRGGSSPLHGRLQELGAVFGTKNGWERADYFGPGEPWRRAGRTSARSAGRGRRTSTASRVEHAGVARAGRDHRHDVVREARRLAARTRSRCSSASAATGSTGPSARSSTRSCSTRAAASSAT